MLDADDILNFDDDEIEYHNEKDIFKNRDLEIWNLISNNSIEELEKYLDLMQRMVHNQDDVLYIIAIYSYLSGSSSAKDFMINFIKKDIQNNNVYSIRHFELTIFILKGLKEIASNDKSFLKQINTYLIQILLKINSKQINFFYELFDVVCDSVFYILQNTDLTKSEKKDIYFILFHFLHNFQYSKLDKLQYKVYLKYYIHIVWRLRDELPNLFTSLFLPIVSGIVYKSMELDTKEEKIKKLLDFGFDINTAQEMIDFIN